MEQHAPIDEYHEPSELTLLREFKKASDCSVEKARSILQTYEGDVRDIHDASKKSLLHIACENMGFRVVKLLVDELNFEFNEQDVSGDTPLHIACSAQRVQSAMYLSNKPSCNPNIKNSDGLTPLHIVTSRRNILLIKHLLGLALLDRSVEDGNGRTAISIIESDPELASHLAKKHSTASLVDPGGIFDKKNMARKGKL